MVTKIAETGEKVEEEMAPAEGSDEGDEEAVEVAGSTLIVEGNGAQLMTMTLEQAAPAKRRRRRRRNQRRKRKEAKSSRQNPQELV